MNLPPEFSDRMRLLLGDDFDKFVASLNKELPVSIRLNGNKFNTELSENIPWCADGYYLDKRPQFTFDPLFHAGCYYVQEASSMFIEQAINQYVDGKIKILDLCAAPGGKSTLLASLIDKDSLLVSNEVVRSRANILAENITKWGQANTVVTNNDPSQIGKLEAFFDVVVVDAPCSGEGMFRKDEGAISEWSLDNVKLCKERQQRILADIWPTLKSGGLLLYSTCTYNLEENEENILWMRDELGAEVLPVEAKEEWGISPSFAEGIPAYRFFPHKTKGEGFFFALLRKGGEEIHTNNRRKTGKVQKNKSDLSIEYKSYIEGEEDFTFYNKRESWHAFPSVLYDDLNHIRTYLHIISEGICLGEFKGKDFIPNQSLALSNVLNKDVFTTYEVDWQTAISYLRKEALVLDDQPKGYILLTYRDVPLGFVKNIGNRANNLYPQEWRIRSTNIPQEKVRII
ncbi:MAG: RsmB/NOP family class I SAM-dependent RNA methyltransferase [Prevotella sp.]|nr:RsmB/NOP family class I SAM-dependent RNA methyltransferase [Prevotella sp.]